MDIEGLLRSLSARNVGQAKEMACAGWRIHVNALLGKSDFNKGSVSI